MNFPPAKKWISKIVKYLVIGLFAFNSLIILVTYNAISSLYMVLLLVIAWMVADFSIKRFAGKNKTNLRLLFTTILILIFVLEISLRTTKNQYKTYTELNGIPSIHRHMYHPI